MTGFPASAIRATVMATVLIFGWALRRPSDVINSLCMAALIILLWDPAQLFQAGFQLSFVVVFCIVLLMPAFQAWGEHLVEFDPWLPVMLRPRWHRLLPEGMVRIPRPSEGPLWERLLRACGRYAWEVLLVSIAAWLGSIPLAALYFHIFTPVSGPANLLAVPACSLVLICNLISLLLSPWFPFGAECYNHMGWAIMECIRQSSQWFAHWPAAWLNVPAPSPATTALYYLLLLALATGWAFRAQYRRAILSGLALLSAAWTIGWALEARTTCMTIVPLKGAASVFVDAPGRFRDLLVNCGEEDSAERILKPFLQAQGVNHLARLVLTHGGVYVVGGTEIIRNNFFPSEIDVSPIRFRSGAYRHLLGKLESAPGLVKKVERGDSIGNWRIIHPVRTDHFAQADDNTLALRVEIRGTRVLFLSSLGKPGQNALFERESDLRADIVVAGIPHQSEPLADGLLDAIHPRLIVIADAQDPAWAQASHRLRERLASRGVPVIYTAQVGAATVIFQRKGWQLRTMHPASKAAEPIPPPSPIADESE